MARAVKRDEKQRLTLSRSSVRLETFRNVSCCPAKLLDAFLPRFAVENVQGMEWVPEYTMFVQHWGMMVGLIGVFMVVAAFKVSWREPLMLYGMIEKAFLVFLVASNWGEDFASGFMIPAAMDSIITVWSILYLATRKGK